MSATDNIAGITGDPETSQGFPITLQNPFPGGGSQEPSHTAYDWWADTFTFGSDEGGVGADDGSSSDSSRDYDDPRATKENAYMPDEQTPDSWRANPNDDGTVTDVHGTQQVMSPEAFNRIYGDKHPDQVDTSAFYDDQFTEQDSSGTNTPGGTERVRDQRPDDQDTQRAPGGEIWEAYGMTREQWIAAQQEQAGPSPTTPPSEPEPRPEPEDVSNSTDGGSLSTVVVAGGGVIGVLGLAYVMGWL